MRLHAAHLRLDGGTQTRAEIDLTVAADYADKMRDGAPFPPVVAFYDGSAYWLADGFHRVTAAKSAGLSELEADVRQGTRRDAILFSVGANAAHGLRRTNADKRRAVETLLRDEEWRAWSDHVVASKCGVSQPFVSKVRAELGLTDNRSQSPERKTADGRVMNTANIGRRDVKPENEPTTAPEPEPIRASEWLDELAEDDAEDEPEEEAEDEPAPHAAPAAAASRSAPVDTTAFDADARELRSLLSEARKVAERLSDRGALLGSAVRGGRVADVRRLIADAIKSLSEVKP